MEIDNTKETDNIKLSGETSDSTQKGFFSKIDVREGKKTLTPEQQIEALLRAKNWNKSKLASEIGMQRQSLNHYLHGFWAVPTSLKVKIAVALNVDSSVIWDLEGRK